MHSCLVLCHITHCILVLLGENTITKHALRHPYRTYSKTRVMGDVEEVQEQMKVDMEADPTHPSAINQANQPTPNMVG